jgi:hypothetical protein
VNQYTKATSFKKYNGVIEQQKAKTYKEGRNGSDWHRESNMYLEQTKMKPI